MSEEKDKLLVVEDDKGLQRQLRWAFEKYNVLLAGDGERALELVRVERPPVVLMDLGLPPDPDGPTSGLATLDRILSVASDTKVIIMTGQSDRALAVRAVGAGAYDFYQKPVEIEELGLIVDRAYQLYKLETEYRRSASDGVNATIPGIVTVNEDMRLLIERIARIAQSNASVLIYGESGTGKELIARGIHSLSGRRGEPFLAINCAAIPDQLLESELFGYEKGAFTGAVRTTPGKVEVADGGILFLDEIGDLTLHLQAKLLRFLQEKVIERIGGRGTIEVDVRIVSATNRDLQQLIESGQFREDLFYRLTETTVDVPPLRERPDDTIVIANHYLREYAAETGSMVRGFTAGALAAISGYDWPGNIRELQNRIKGAVINAQGSRVTATDLDLTAITETFEVEPLKKVLERVERETIRNAIAATEGNISKAAKLLDISRPKLYDLMNYHKLRSEA